jgi:hypothetical protein
LLKRFFNILNKKKRNTQPENARIANRAVKFAKLAEINNVSLSDTDGFADKITEITDAELERSVGASGIVGCPANIIPLYAGFSQSCAICPYFAKEAAGNGQERCALKN